MGTIETDIEATNTALGTVNTNLDDIETNQTDGSQKTQIVDDLGVTVTSFGSPSTIAAYISPMDFTATYTSASTITLSGVPFVIATGANIVYIKVRNSSTNVTKTYINGSAGYSFAHSGGVVTAYLNGTVASIFTTNDMYEVGVNAQTKSYDPSLDITKIINQSPDRASYVVDTLVHTTNVAAATNYYPSALGMSMDGFKDLCLSGRLIDADGTVDVTVEVSNNPDPATGIFHQVYGYDAEANAMVNTVGCNNSTKTFVWDFDNLNATWFRIKSITSGATNTVGLFIRRKSL